MTWKLANLMSSSELGPQKMSLLVGQTKQISGGLFVIFDADFTL